MSVFWAHIQLINFRGREIPSSPVSHLTYSIDWSSERGITWPVWVRTLLRSQGQVSLSKYAFFFYRNFLLSSAVSTRRAKVLLNSTAFIWVSFSYDTFQPMIHFEFISERQTDVEFTSIPLHIDAEFSHTVCFSLVPSLDLLCSLARFSSSCLSLPH